LPPRDDRVLLYDIRQSVARIRQYTSEGREAFFNSSMIQDAVIRNLEIIGEAASKLPADTKTDLSGVPWRRVIGMRNILIHGYATVDLETVWAVIQEDLPALEHVLQKRTS
jgi:uncharacterized protein with HEPN domain